MNTLKEYRIKKGVKQNAIAKALGVTRQTYARYEENQEKMSLAQAKAVCHFLNCDISDIFLAQKVS